MQFDEIQRKHGSCTPQILSRKALTHLPKPHAKQSRTSLKKVRQDKFTNRLYNGQTRTMTMVFLKPQKIAKNDILLR